MAKFTKEDWWKDTVLDYDGEEVGVILREFPKEVVSDALGMAESTRAL